VGVAVPVDIGVNSWLGTQYTRATTAADDGA
jgi:hypothetical protein